jgi:hypothetical protein
VAAEKTNLYNVANRITSGRHCSPSLIQSNIRRAAVEFSPALELPDAIVLVFSFGDPSRWESFEGQPDGELWLTRPVDEELKAKNFEQMKVSLASKLPKLAAHRPPEGRTLLVLETPDFHCQRMDCHRSCYEPYGERHPRRRCLGKVAMRAIRRDDPPDRADAERGSRCANPAF